MTHPDAPTCTDRIRLRITNRETIDLGRLKLCANCQLRFDSMLRNTKLTEVTFREATEQYPCTDRRPPSQLTKIDANVLRICPDCENRTHHRVYVQGESAKLKCSKCGSIYEPSPDYSNALTELIAEPS